MRKNKFLIIVLVIVLSVGFASISTTLIINGMANFGFNSNDFSSSVVYTRAEMKDGTAKINNEDKNIDFETIKMQDINQESILEFDVTNKSRQYDADVTIVCGLKEEFTSFSSYFDIEMDLESPFYLEAGNTKTGTLTVKMKKPYNESLDTAIELACKLVASPLERDSLGRSIHEGENWLFGYTGEEKEFVTPFSGLYKLEVWGAQGGSAYSDGGTGGYSVGEINLKENETLYINVGEQPQAAAAGFNGGATGYEFPAAGLLRSGGGGATDIRYQTNSILNRIIVAGGGGGGATYVGVLIPGGNAGGFESGTFYYSSWMESTNSSINTGATQKSSGATSIDPWGYGIDFYPGSLGESVGESGGGGGYYGGPYYLTVNRSYGGIGGSSYIGNSLLINKAMYCNDCKESSDENTKTISTENVSEDPISGYAKYGNGYARITYLG